MNLDSVIEKIEPQAQVIKVLKDLRYMLKEVRRGYQLKRIEFEQPESSMGRNLEICVNISSLFSPALKNAIIYELEKQIKEYETSIAGWR